MPIPELKFGSTSGSDSNEDELEIIRYLRYEEPISFDRFTRRKYNMKKTTKQQMKADWALYI